MNADTFENRALIEGADAWGQFLLAHPEIKEAHRAWKSALASKNPSAPALRRVYMTVLAKAQGRN